MRYVVIGGDAAGMSAASRLKRREPDAEVVVYEKTDDVSYSACGMPYNIADADKPIADLVVRSADAFRNAQGINLHTGHKIDRIDKAAKKVFGTASDGTDFESSYDKLLIATGASAIRPDVPGANLEGVFVLKTLQDSRYIKGFLEENSVKKAVIVGMGYIALEMAEALTARGIAVTMIKKREQLLPWMIPDLSGVVRKALEAEGINLNPGLSLESVEKTGAGLAVTAGGRSFDCDMVLFAIGVKPESGLAAEAGLELGAAGAVSIDKTMRTSDPDIFAAGDCADALSVVSGRKVWLPLALTANRGGRLAADNMLGDEQLFNGIAGTGVFKVFDVEVARTGLTVEEAEAAGFDPVYKPVVAKSKAHVFEGAAPLHASFIADKASGRILGAQMVGTEGVARRINAAAVALQAGMTLADFYECDLAYAPPFSPVWDPLLTAASLLMKKTGK
ncbi:MAG: FAD-dependent oxidoreductase [Spirochaetales bacterium]|uniref:FAD-dependent oxidoreductase n=1 Tax=Candidatus Thalassospirochaeta sargassi TaxID=3119039 RepID=A0AAJ1IBS4_9SPIO|nr:FAD-dependent oxidoreductase [Spirochaetales bacterium]